MSRVAPGSRVAAPDASTGAVARPRAERYPLFDAIRLGAALLVILSHAYTATGREEPLPIQFSRLGVTWGHIGVAIFFVTSGFLVARSWVGEPRAGRFALKRGMRIWPAFLVVLVLCTVVVGPLVTTASLPTYFHNALTWNYLGHNAVMAPISFYLPGVFTHQPLHGVNGNLWTLPFEVAAYVLLLALGLTRLLRRWVLVGLLAVGLVAYQAMVATHWIPRQWHWNGMWLDDFVRLEVWFVAGALAALCASHVVRRHLSAVVALGAVALGVHWHAAALTIPALAFLVIYVGTLPCPRAEVLHRLGDPSYGMYLTGFVFQQLLVWVGIARGNWWMAFLGGVAFATTFGYLSWHLVEKRAMRLTKHRARPPTAPAATAGDTNFDGTGDGADALAGDAEPAEDGRPLEPALS